MESNGCMLDEAKLMLMNLHANVQKPQMVSKSQLEISTLPHAAIGGHIFAPLIQIRSC
jgi:hypothetical protein